MPSLALVLQSSISCVRRVPSRLRSGISNCPVSGDIRHSDKTTGQSESYAIYVSVR
jgi:hypothetical protein